MSGGTGDIAQLNTTAGGNAVYDDYYYYDTGNATFDSYTAFLNDYEPNYEINIIGAIRQNKTKYRKGGDKASPRDYIQQPVQQPHENYAAPPVQPTQASAVPPQVIIYTPPPYQVKGTKQRGGRQLSSPLLNIMGSKAIVLTLASLLALKGSLFYGRKKRNANELNFDEVSMGNIGSNVKNTLLKVSF